jgi:hypothetical protein
MKSKFVGLLGVAIMMAISLFAEAKIIRVPEDYPTIQEGIDAALTGDIVLVADGTYTGDGNKNLDFKGKAITVQSENGPESTIIDCEGSGRGFYFHSRENIGAKVKGFTIKNGASSGIYCNDSSPSIEGNKITNNSASPGVESYGGGIACVASSPTIQDNDIMYNSASYGGGISCNDSSPIIQNNDITHNASAYGGGIYCISSSPTIQNNDITYNSVSDYGGGIYCYYSSPTTQNNYITDNSANSGGGICCTYYSNPNITNNFITQNEAIYGGGISVESSFASPSIINSTIAYNLAHYGGGVYCEHYSLTVLNSILYFDSALASGNEIYVNGGIFTVTYSDVDGGWEGEGNIDADPLFVDAANGDYHLSDSSPCIGAGIMTTGVPTEDFEGDPRPNPPASNPDIGADENPLAEPISGDTGAINGTVTDKETGDPIPKAIVIAINIETKEKFIDPKADNGFYEILNLQPGNYLVICIATGYNPGIAKKVVVEAGKTTTRDFALVPK